MPSLHVMTSWPIRCFCSRWHFKNKLWPDLFIVLYCHLLEKLVKVIATEIEWAYIFQGKKQLAESINIHKGKFKNFNEEEVKRRWKGELIGEKERFLFVCLKHEQNWTGSTMGRINRSETDANLGFFSYWEFSLFLMDT